jgi:hypothetical protein
VKRILIRSGKSPFHVAGHPEYLHRDLMGTNTGNLLFSDSAHKMLTTPRATVTSNGIRTDCSAAKAAQINEEYDVFVVPLANAFRPSFRASLDRLSTLIEQLTVPVVVFGVGAQAGADYDTEELRPMADSVKRFARAVLERSASIGVRGELTASYLNELGFADTDIIGCPSMFLYGDTFPAIREARSFDAASRIALNLSPDALPVGDVSGLAAEAHRRFPQLTYFAQNISDAQALFWGDTSAEAGRVDDFPLLLSHPLFVEDKVTVPLDPKVWIEELAGYDFAYGTRIHGNVAALLAGTPSVVLAHDSRTLELCRYFDIPYRMLPELPGDVDPQELYDGADFGPMLKGHQERFSRMTAFLARNDLENTYEHGDGGVEFDRRMAGLDLPPSVRLWNGGDDGALRYRFARLREQHAEAGRRMDGLRNQNDRLRRDLESVKKKNADQDRRLTALEKQLARTEKKVTGIDKRLMVRIGPALRRRIGLGGKAKKDPTQT